MTETTDAVREARRARHHAIRADIAQEEAEAAQSEIVEKAAALDVPLHLRIDRELDAQARPRTRLSLAAKLAANGTRTSEFQQTPPEAVMRADLQICTAVETCGHRLALLKSVGSAVRARP